MIVVKEVRSKRQLKAFVKFPFELYKDSRYWVPPIIKEEMAVFNPSKNPILKDANLKLFLAYQDRELVGRVAAIVNWIEVSRCSCIANKRVAGNWKFTLGDNLTDFKSRKLRHLRPSRQALRWRCRQACLACQRSRY